MRTTGKGKGKGNETRDMDEEKGRGVKRQGIRCSESTAT